MSKVISLGTCGKCGSPLKKVSAHGYVCPNCNIGYRIKKKEPEIRVRRRAKA